MRFNADVADNQPVIDLLLADTPTFLGLMPASWIEGHYTKLEDGHFGVQLASGKWLSVQPQGGYEERDAAQGPYEWFLLDTTVNVLRVTPLTVPP